MYVPTPPYVNKDRDPETDVERTIFRVARFLTFDQSLSNTGWAVVDGPNREVEACGVIRPEGIFPTVTGFNLTFEKARQLEEGLKGVLDEHARTVDEILFEMPAVVGHRVESSLLAAEKLLTVCRLLNLPRPTMVSRQHAMKVLDIDPRAIPKKDIKKVTGAKVDAVILKHPVRPWNEHIRDAVFLAISEGIDNDPRSFMTYQGVAQP